MKKMHWSSIVGRGLFALICIVALLCGDVAYAKDENIKVSNKEYLVNINNSERVYMCNDKAVSGKVGSKVFITYTVDQVSENDVFRSGVCAAEEKENPAPFSGVGKFYYSKRVNLYDPGWTYVYRMERTENGFEYHAARMKDDVTETIFFSAETSASAMDPFKYYGILFECQGELSAILTHVRCYDENGKDLGVYFNHPSGMVSTLMDVHYPVGSKYSFEIAKGNSVAISNKYPTDSEVIYIEFEVEDVKDDKTTQHGFLCSWRPTDTHPHANNNGVILWQKQDKDAKNKLMLTEGTKYFACLTKRDGQFQAILQCTKNGKTETIPFTGKSVSEGMQYYSLWFGEGEFSAKFQNVKCYDKDGNSLGIQVNKQNVQVSHIGESENYDQAKAVYYCKETKDIIVLSDDKKAVKQFGEKKEECSYKIMDDDNLILLTKDGKESYDYAWLQMIDEDGNRYDRLKDKKVTFVNGADKKVVMATAETGYKVAEPEKPTKEGNTFKGWFLSDDEAFDFDAIVTEAFTVYAKWQDAEGREYLAVDGEADGINTDYAMIITLAAVAAVAVISVTAVCLIARRKKHGSTN